MTGRALRRLAAGVLLAVTASPAPAAQQTPSSDPLTLAEALATAGRESPALAVERSAVDRAAADRLGSVGALLPALDATAGFTTTWTRRFTTTGDFGDPATREEAVEATTRSSFQGVGLSAILFDGGERWTDLSVGTARREAARASLAARWTEVRAEVARAYVTLVERREVVEVERAILESRRADVERTEALFRVAAADRIDLLGARIEARRQEALLAGALEEAAKAELALGRAMGTGSAAREALLLPVEPFDPDSLEIEVTVRAALDDHPTIVRDRAELRAAEAEAASEGWLAWLPSLGVSAGWNRSEFGGPDLPFFELDPRNSSWDVGISLSLPLFDRFSRRVERARARAAVDAADANLRVARLDVESEMRSRLLDLRDAWRRLEIERAAAALARERAEMAREHHRIGAIDFVRLQEVVDQSTAAERAVVAARHGWYRAVVELERAAGRGIVLPDPGP